MTTTDPCSFLGCDDKRCAKGLCLAHYRQHRRDDPLAPVARRTAAEGCAVDGRDRPRAGGLCTAHYAQQQRGQELRPLEVTTSWPTCEFPGCDRPRLSKGWCAGHYSQHGEGRPPSSSSPSGLDSLSRSWPVSRSDCWVATTTLTPCAPT
jgi:hypothetical protein